MGHVGFGAAGVRGNEIGDQLLTTSARGLVKRVVFRRITLGSKACILLGSKARNLFGNGNPLTLVLEQFELLVERFELLEVRLPHEVEDGVARMFGCDFEAAGDVVEDDFTEVFVVVFVNARILRRGSEEVVADAASDKGFFDAWDGVDGTV